MVQRISIR